MRISRIFVHFPLVPNGEISFDDDSAHYIRKVLRLKKSDILSVFDGTGGEYRASLTLVSRKEVTARLGDWHDIQSESPLAIRLAVGISRGERMDFVVQKSVELGVRTIWPLNTERTVVKLDQERAGQKQAHWANIARNACEQCGRDTLPEVAHPVHFPDWTAPEQGLRVFLDPTSKLRFSDLDCDSGEILMLSGPEGGFSERERRQALACGFVGVRIGPRVLRTETAVLAGMAIAQTLWGDMA